MDDVKRYVICIDKVGYKHKPSAKPYDENPLILEDGPASSNQVAGISRRLPESIRTPTFDEFCKAITSGRSFMQSVFMTHPRSGKRKRLQALFESCQIATVDFDKGNITPEEIINTGWFSIVYETFSYTKECPKYRAVALFDEQIRDRELALKINYYFVEDLFKDKADPACKDVTRISYGTNRDIIYAVERPIPISELHALVRNTKLPKFKQARLPDDSVTTNHNCTLDEQKKILRSLPTPIAKYVESQLMLYIQDIKSLTASKGARYPTLWNAAAYIGRMQLVRRNIAINLLSAAVAANPHFDSWDKDPIYTIASGYDWGFNNYDESLKQWIDRLL